MAKKPTAAPAPVAVTPQEINRKLRAERNKRRMERKEVKGSVFARVRLRHRHLTKSAFANIVRIAKASDPSTTQSQAIRAAGYHF